MTEMHRPLAAAAALAAARRRRARAGRPDARPCRMPARWADARLDFAAIDTNGTARSAAPSCRPGRSPGSAVADTNGDGALDRAELIAVLPDGRGPARRASSRVDPAEAMADRLLALMGGTESRQGRGGGARRATGETGSSPSPTPTATRRSRKAEADAMQARLAGWRDRGRHGGPRGDGHDRPNGPPPPPGAPAARRPGRHRPDDARGARRPRRAPRFGTRRRRRKGP